MELLFPAEFLEDGNAGAGAVNTTQSTLAFLTGIALRFPELPAKAENRPELSFLPEQSATIHSGAWSSSVEGSVFGNLADSVAKLRTAGILPKNNPTDADAQCFVSDTGELSLDTRARRLKVITPKTEAVILKPDDTNIALRRLTVHSVDTGCAAAVTSLDDLPLAESRHMMFVLNTNSVSEGLVLSGDRSTLIEPGKNAPPRLAPVRRKELETLSAEPERRAPETAARHAADRRDCIPARHRPSARRNHALLRTERRISPFWKMVFSRRLCFFCSAASRTARSPRLCR